MLSSVLRSTFSTNVGIIIVANTDLWGQQPGFPSDNRAEVGPGLITQATQYVCSSVLKIVFFPFITERIKWHDSIKNPKCWSIMYITIIISKSPRSYVSTDFFKLYFSLSSLKIFPTNIFWISLNLTNIILENDDDDFPGEKDVFILVVYQIRLDNIFHLPTGSC